MSQITLHVDEDNVLEWDEVALGTTGAFANTATITATLLKRIATNGVMSAGDATLTCASAPFAAGDVGRTITVKGAGTDGEMLRTTIASVTSASEVELSTAAVKAVTAAHIERSLDNAKDISMAYVASSDGRYQGMLPNTVPLVHGQKYVLELTGAQSGADGFRRIHCIAQYHEDT